MTTLWTWVVLSELMFAVLLGIIWNRRRNEQALIYWTLTSACLALGCLGFSLRGQIPDWLSIGVANVFYALSWSLRWAGLRVFAGQQLRLLWVLGPPLLLGMVFEWREVLGLDAAERIMLVATLCASYSLLIITDTLRAQHHERLSMRRILIAISALAAVMESLRILHTWQSESAEQFLAQSPLNANYLLGLICVFALYDFACFLMVFERHERSLVRNATVDSLTNVLNRVGFSDLSSRQLQRNFRDHQPVSVLVMDLDFFKAVNDRYGHDAGDAVLRAFAQTARAALRPTDLLARAGGEEFWALLPQADLAEAYRSAQRICDRFRALRVPFDQHHITTTVSIGAATVNLPGESIQSAIARADQALYAAKSQGRDRVTAAGPLSVMA